MLHFGELNYADASRQAVKDMIEDIAAALEITVRRIKMSSEKYKEKCCTVVSQESIGAGIYSMWIQTDQIAADAKPGQFVSLYYKR